MKELCMAMSFDVFHFALLDNEETKKYVAILKLKSSFMLESCDIKQACETKQMPEFK